MEQKNKRVNIEKPLTNFINRCLLYKLKNKNYDNRCRRKV